MAKNIQKLLADGKLWKRLFQWIALMGLFVCWVFNQHSCIMAIRNTQRMLKWPWRGTWRLRRQILTSTMPPISSMARLHLPASSDYAYFLCDLWYFCEGVGSLVLISWDWSMGQWWAYCCSVFDSSWFLGVCMAYWMWGAKANHLGSWVWDASWVLATIMTSHSCWKCNTKLRMQVFV